jgi:hypothetical protein
LSATIINIIIKLIAGAVGGNAADAGLKNYDLGTLGARPDRHRGRAFVYAPPASLTR